MEEILMRKLAGAVVFLLLLGITAIGCTGFASGEDVPVPSSTAYKGHENDVDMNIFIFANPVALGTRLDDCQVCHTAGEVVYDDDDVEMLNPCSYCHLIAYPDPDVVSGAPASYRDTLNQYGLDYLNAGRTQSAVNQIGNMDSDNDGFINVVEITNLYYPGDATSIPGQPTAPIYTFTREAIEALPLHTQLTLMNSHRQEFDDYAWYAGVRIRDLLDAAVVDLTDATGITIIAPDGFAMDFSIEEVYMQYPDGLFYEDLDPESFITLEQGFVNYPPIDLLETLGLVDGGVIPHGQWMIIAYERDELPIDQSLLNPENGKIDGEGPYRHVVPQSEPGSPDRGSKYSPTEFDDGWDYDENKDHNAGSCVKGVVAIRINPMPSGYEEFDWKNGGWSLITNELIIIYGMGVTPN